MTVRTLLMSGLAGFALLAIAAAVPAAAAPADKVREAVTRLLARHGASHAARIEAGVAQVAARWWASDGDAAAFVAFCEDELRRRRGRARRRVRRASRRCSSRSTATSTRCAASSSRRSTSTPGRCRASTSCSATLDLGAHVDEDLFATKVAFFALLNFPVHTLAAAPRARARAGTARPGRAPGAGALRRRGCRPRCRQEITRATTAADQYIAGYNIRMDRLLDAQGERLVPRGAAPDHPLGAARRAQVAVRPARRPRAAAPDPAGDGAHRPPGDPARGDRQPGRSSGAPTPTSVRPRRAPRRAHRRDAAARAGHPLRRRSSTCFRALRAGRPLHPDRPDLHRPRLRARPPDAARRRSRRCCLGARLAPRCGTPPR